jgi:hypothetical protein
LRAEISRVGAELAGQMVGVTKEKTGYQLYHMHRVAEIKEDLGVKHHEAFKRAAKDWSRLPHKEKDWYNNRADKKPIVKPDKNAIREDKSAVNSAIDNLLNQVDLHVQPSDENPLPVDSPTNSNCDVVGNEWACSSCGNGDAGAPGGVCLMCAAFGSATMI